ncbi:hypothetical protein D9611_013057 [Ephemerocybe angulata]|uniref:Uncharacterized protein n=1 Tax=Ephemerocybe angulata TaxID=980116 RepID=A0A8H5AUK9_9AGAR|nr:hypothetical protein D9611_013057 [Tulosesus angulatus]
MERFQGRTRTRLSAVALTRRPTKRRSAPRPKKSTADKEAAKERNAIRREKLQAALDEARDDLWEKAQALSAELGDHTADWYYGAIIQRGCKPKKRRKLSTWRAFVSKKLKEKNSDLETGERLKIGETSAELSKEWAEMSHEEKEEAVRQYIMDYEEDLDDDTTPVKNVALSSFHDARATVEHIRNESKALYSRTGIHILFFAVRSRLDQYNKPYVFCTGNEFDKFFTAAFNSNLVDTAVRLEAFMISGVHTITTNYSDGIVEYKKSLVKLIHQALEKAAGCHVPRIYYDNFDSKITIPYRVVVKGWPLDKFCSPANIGSKNDLIKLTTALTNGDTFFEKLGDDEYEEFCEAHQAAVAAAAKAVEDEEDEAEAGDEATNAAEPVATSAPQDATMSGADAAVTNSAQTDSSEIQVAAGNEPAPSASLPSSESPPLPSPESLPSAPTIPQGTATALSEVSGNAPSTSRRRPATSEPSTDTRTNKRPKRGEFVMWAPPQAASVTDSSGNPVAVRTSKRQERSDKGGKHKKRGKGKENAPAAAS